MAGRMRPNPHLPLVSRRQFIRSTAVASAAAAGMSAGLLPSLGGAQVKGDRPPAAPEGVAVLNPMDRVPVSLIIDDSTCLVNLNRFAVPQFAEAWAASRSFDPQPPRFEQKWRDWPHEIPDAFVRKFGH